MKKRLFALLMTLIMVVSLLPVGAFAADEVCSHIDGTDGDYDCKCDNCGSTVHTFNTDVFGKDATCTEDGEKPHKKCTICGVPQSGNFVIPAAGHDYNNDGKCTVCGAEHECEFGIHVNGVNATCTEDGVKPHDKCAYCGKTKGYEVIPATGHDYNNDGKCTVCGAEHECEFGIHVNGIDATCTEDGVKPHDKCAYCGKTKGYEIIPATGHKAADAVKENEKAATCEAAGSYDEVVYCTACNEELSRETQTVASLGHKWDAGKVTKAPTATAKGVKTFTCANDASHTKTEDIAALGNATSNAGLDNVPKTGDATDIFMFGGMMIVALFGAVVTFFSAKKRNNH